MLSAPSSAYDDHAIIDLAGGSVAHSALCARLASLIDQALRDGPCLVHTSDVKVKMTSPRLYWLLGTSVQEIGLLCTVEHAFLPHYLR